tara:strand:+ start:1121 stop:1330 length:210 start_codon:yes stop_codon:yes gene_type:complete
MSSVREKRAAVQKEANKMEEALRLGQVPVKDKVEEVKAEPVVEKPVVENKAPAKKAAPKAKAKTAKKSK